MKRLKICLFIFIFFSIPGNSEICGVGLLSREDLVSLQWLIEVFRNNNEMWPNTTKVMTDKDQTLRKVLSKTFPNAKLLLCKFHVLQAFKREVLHGLIYM